MKTIEEYIGDGVYVVFDGFAYTLDLRAQAPTLPVTKIMLEPNIIDRLNEFRKRIEKMTQEQLEATAKETT